jgi:hypothetical protein
VRVRVDAQRHCYDVNHDPLMEIEGMVGAYPFDRLEALLNELQAKEQDNEQD